MTFEKFPNASADQGLGRVAILCSGVGCSFPGPHRLLCKSNYIEVHIQLPLDYPIVMSDLAHIQEQEQF